MDHDMPTGDLRLKVPDLGLATAEFIEQWKRATANIHPVALLPEPSAVVRSRRRRELADHLDPVAALEREGTTAAALLEVLETLRRLCDAPDDAVVRGYARATLARFGIEPGARS